MRQLLVILITVITFSSVAAQSGPWCGYALIDNLPLLDNQLAVLAAITPTVNARSKPDELFQYRFNLAHTAVIIEGCFQAYPSRELITSLLQQTVKVVPTPTPKGFINLSPDLPVDPVKTLLDQEMGYLLFAPDGSRDDGAAAVRAYIEANSKDWEEGGP